MADFEQIEIIEPEETKNDFFYSLSLDDLIDKSKADAVKDNYENKYAHLPKFQKKGVKKTFTKRGKKYEYGSIQNRRY